MTPHQCPRCSTRSKITASLMPREAIIRIATAPYCPRGYLAMVRATKLASGITLLVYGALLLSSLYAILTN